MGFKRKRFVAVALDGAFRAPAVAPLLQRLVQARAEAQADGVGLGVVSMLSFEDTVKALQVRCQQHVCIPLSHMQASASLVARSAPAYSLHMCALYSLDRCRGSCIMTLTWRCSSAHCEAEM